MRRDLRVIGGLAIAAVAVAVPVLLVVLALPPRTVSELAFTQAGEFPVLPVLYNQQYPVTPIRLEKSDGSSQQLEVDTPSFPNLRGVLLELAVATYLRAPTQAIQLTLLGPDRERLGSCRIAPSLYHDNGLITCPVGRPERLRHVVVSASGQAPLAVYAAKEGDQLVAGALVRHRRLDSLGARLHALSQSLGVLRPRLFSPPLLIVFSVLSAALFGAALLLALDQEGRFLRAGAKSPEPPDGRTAPSHESGARS